MWLLAALACRHAPPPAVADEPTEEVRTWYLTARVAEARGDRAVALRAWTWLVRMDPGASAGWEGLGGVLEALERPTEALSVWVNAASVADGPGVARAALGQGRVLVTLGRPAEAIPLLERAVLTEPAAWEWLARAVSSGELDATTARWRAADPTPAAEFTRGVVARDLGAPAVAVDRWLAVLADPEVGDDAASALLGAMQESCRFASVNRSFVDAPPTEPPWTTLAIAAARRVGDPDLAALLSGTDRLEALLAAGRTAEVRAATMGEPSLAAWNTWALALEGRAAEAAKTAGPDVRSQALVANAWLEAGELARAEATLAALSSAEPEVALVQMRLALRRGDVEAARRAAEAGGLVAMRQLAQFLAERGEVAAAHAAWRLVLAVVPDDPDAWLGVGEAERALASDPCHVGALRAVAPGRGCAGWHALWEVAPRDPLLSAGRGACPELPSWPEGK